MEHERGEPGNLQDLYTFVDWGNEFAMHDNVEALRKIDERTIEFETFDITE